MIPASLPPLSFFLEKVVSINNLTHGISAYSQMLQDRISIIDVYEDPMSYVEIIDYKEKIDNFLAILEDERSRTKNTKNESSSNAGAYDNGKTKR